MIGPRNGQADLAGFFFFSSLDCSPSCEISIAEWLLGSATFQIFPKNSLSHLLLCKLSHSILGFLTWDFPHFTIATSCRSVHHYLRTVYVVTCTYGYTYFVIVLATLHRQSVHGSFQYHCSRWLYIQTTDFPLTFLLYTIHNDQSWYVQRYLTYVENTAPYSGEQEQLVAVPPTSTFREDQLW